jgi:hypothetical protein
VYGCVIYKTGFGLDDWIYCEFYIHTVRDHRQYNIIVILHTSQFTVAHALGFTASTSRILATVLAVSLALQITCEVFFAPPNSFLAIPGATNSETRLDSTRQLLYTPLYSVF